MTQTSDSNGNPSPAEALAFLWRGRRWILIFTVGATLLGALFAFGRGTTWQVQALISVDRGAQGLLGAGTGFNAAPQPRNYANREAEVLRSVPVLATALESEAVAESKLLRGEANKIKWLKNKLKVQVGEEDGVLALSLDSKRPEEACTVVNAVVDAFRTHDLELRGKVAGQALSRLHKQLDQAETEYGTYQAELSRFLDDHPHVATFDDLRDQRIKLLTEVTPEHPAILEIDRKLGSMEEDVSVYESLRMRADRVRTLADTLYQRIREIDVNENVAGDVGSSAIRIWEYASPEAAEVSSSKISILMLAAFLGLMAGAAFAWGSSMLDDRIHSPAEVSARFNLLASVPEMHNGVQVTQLWRDNPGFANSMSTLRAMLDQDMQNNAKVIQVTSPGRGEGKTLVAAGLGIAMAQSHRATLILDAHLSAPGLAHAFRHENSRGLSDVLRHQYDGGVPALIWETPVRNLYVLPAGDPSNDALSLLNDPRFGELLGELRARFDRIIVDSAPSVGSAEAHLAATACDQALVVLANGETRARDAREAIDAISALRSKVSGVVLNRHPRLAKVSPNSKAVPTPPRDESPGQPKVRVLQGAHKPDPRV